MTADVEKRKYPPYMFDVDFDTPSVAAEQHDDVEPVRPPTVSLEELAAAREEALAIGRAEGIAQSSAGFENQIAATLGAIAHTLTTLEETQRRANEDTARDAVKLAIAAATKLMPHYAQKHGLAEIEIFIAQCLAGLFGDAVLTIRVPETLMAELRARIEPIAQQAGFEEGLKLVADPALGPADCRIEWNDGGATRNAASLASEIDDIVENFMEQPPTPPSDATSPAPNMPEMAQDVPEMAQDVPEMAQDAPDVTQYVQDVAQDVQDVQDGTQADVGPAMPPPPQAGIAAHPATTQPQTMVLAVDPPTPQTATDQTGDTAPPIVDVAREDSAAIEITPPPETQQGPATVLPGAVDMNSQTP